MHGVAKLHRKMKRSKMAGNIETAILYLILIALSILFIIPFLWLLFGSFKEGSELFRAPFRWLPDRLQFDNYKQMFTAIPFFKYLKNTLIIVFFNIVGSSVSSSFVAYGFARLRWRFRNKVFMIVLATMVLPFQVTMIPLFIMYTKWGWIGTFLPLTITCFFGNPFFIFLFRQFFVGLPKELTYAARVDGANEFRIYSTIILPLAKPCITTVAIFAFMRTWNDFIGPLVFLADDDLYTLSLAAQLLQSNLDPRWHILLALGVVMVLPVLIIFFLMQKYFIQGVAMSGIKE